VSDATPPSVPQKNNTKNILMIVAGVVVFCCLCCGVLLLGQYLLENSNLTLVNILHFVG
jgi:hypothetical protein